MNVKVLDKILDERINSSNVLVKMTIGDYISIAKDIIDKNEFQRNKVNSKTVYSLLRDDLKLGCSIPPIVLAIRSEKLNGIDNYNELSDDEIKNLLSPDSLIILDGLQRTSNILSLVTELSNDENAQESLKKLLSRPLRIEIYIGLNKIGILYRMLTLNTGQTPMSARHQIEILYSDLLDSTDMQAQIKFYREKDKTKIRLIGEYNFKDAIEGFNSYLEADELGMDRTDILSEIKTNTDHLENLASENNRSDIFKDYITTYTKMVEKINTLTNSWTNKELEFDGRKPFGSSILEIFSKSQALTGFGGALGQIKKIDKDNGITSDVKSICIGIDEIKLGGNSDEVIIELLKSFDGIRAKAKNIGRDQRVVFKWIFRELFNSEGDSYLNLKKAIKEGTKKYIREYVEF